MKEKSASPIEWFLPVAFIICIGWVIWHLPAFLIDFIPYASESRASQVLAIHNRNDFTPGFSGLFGGVADIFDWIALVLIPILFVIGVKTVTRASMEYDSNNIFDRISLFIGRVTMLAIVIMTSVMLYEVFLRYVVEKPTIWANELTLWLAGFVFLLSGLYAMQQRSHIRIYLLYDIVPRWMQRLFDTISTFLIVVFAAALIYGSYKQVFVNKLYRWETFGTAFDPPIPATLQPMILIAVTLVAVQAVVNLIADWNNEPTVHTAADDIDQEELEELKRSLGTK